MRGVGAIGQSAGGSSHVHHVGPMEPSQGVAMLWGKSAPLTLSHLSGLFSLHCVYVHTGVYVPYIHMWTGEDNFGSHVSLHKGGPGITPGLQA